MSYVVPRAAAVALAVLAASYSLPSRAAEWDYLSRFAGSFAGGGTVQRSAKESPSQVTCKFVGQPSETGVSMTGKCGAFIFSRSISADLRYDAATGRYSGSYIGSSIGPARLSGKRTGDAIVLTITWPQPVNGDTKATMTIRNTGNGRLAITVTDKLTPSGASSHVTQIALNQS
jgi:hypothetical protein